LGQGLALLGGQLAQLLDKPLKLSSLHSHLPSATDGRIITQQHGRTEPKTFAESAPRCRYRV
ncbi:MAG: hypothetical protein SFW09_10060, partial [Hyphomicrobiaceae bacterium]|nr:hypothetical protein [Hyphomicrobiaceae bacterium]